MFVTTVPVTVSPVSLFIALDGHDRHVSQIGLQAAIANTGDVSWGDNNNQNVILAAGESALIPVGNTKDVWFKGTANDNLVVILF